jgi:glyoxylase-like metal-dependent hydrolase (beta-lactamase superfamily II)
MIDRRNFLTTSAAAVACGYPTKCFPQQVAPASPALGQLTILSDGSFEMPLSALARDRSLDEIKAATRLDGPAMSTVLNVTCLRRGQDTIIFDCGSGAHFLPGTGKLAASLEKMGIAADSVTHVLFTHLHPDHFWGVLDDFDTLSFPNARWMAHEREVAFWTDPGVFERLPEDRQSFAAGAQHMVKALGEKLELKRAEQEWLPGIMALNTPGHTPAHVSFELKDDAGPLVILGDALTHPIVSFGHPDWIPALDHEPEIAVATRRRLLDRAAAEKLRIVGYHLPGGMGRAEKEGLAFRFVQPA